MSGGHCGKPVENRSKLNVSKEVQLECHLPLPLCPYPLGAGCFPGYRPLQGLLPEKPQISYLGTMWAYVPVRTHRCVLLWTHALVL